MPLIKRLARIGAALFTLGGLMIVLPEPAHAAWDWTGCEAGKVCVWIDHDPNADPPPRMEQLTPAPEQCLPLPDGIVRSMYNRTDMDFDTYLRWETVFGPIVINNGCFFKMNTGYEFSDGQVMDYDPAVYWGWQHAPFAALGARGGNGCQCPPPPGWTA